MEHDDEDEEEDENEIDEGEKDSDGEEIAKRMTKTRVFSITEVGFDSDEDDEDDIQFVPSARTVTCFRSGY